MRNLRSMLVTGAAVAAAVVGGAAIGERRDLEQLDQFVIPELRQRPGSRAIELPRARVRGM